MKRCQRTENNQRGPKKEKSHSPSIMHSLQKSADTLISNQKVKNNTNIDTTHEEYGEDDEATAIDNSSRHYSSLLTIPQVAVSLGICRAHVYKLISQGLPVIHLGRSIRVHSTSLDQWLLEQQTSQR